MSKETLRILPWVFLLVLTATLPACSAGAPAPEAGAVADGADAAKPRPLFLIWITDEDGESRFGYIDRKGQVLIPPRFREGYPFHDELALVVADGKWAYLKPSGEVAFSLPDDHVAPGFFSEGRAEVNVGGEVGYHFVSGGAWGYLDRTGRLAIRPQFQARGICPVGTFSEGLAPVWQEEHWGYIDLDGNLVIPCRFESAYSFREGLAAVCIDGKWGFIDRRGRIVIAPEFDEVEGFREGMALVIRKDDSEPSGFIDKTGKLVIRLNEWQKRGGRPTFSEGLAPVALHVRSKIVALDAICNSCAAPVHGSWYWTPCPACGSEITGDSKYGYIDRKGTTAIAPAFDDAYPFSEGLAAVKVDDATGGAWNFIDKQGRMVIEPRLLSVREPGFKNGLAAVKFRTPGKGVGEHEDEGIDAYVDRTGRIVWHESIYGKEFESRE